MLPIIVAGSRPAVAGLAQSQHFDCDTSADLHRLRRASITETARSRLSFASTVLLNPIGSYRLPHPHQPNRHRARRTASRIPSRDFLLWRFANAGPQAAEFAATSVTGRHPKTFTLPDSCTAANGTLIPSVGKAASLWASAERLRSRRGNRIAQVWIRSIIGIRLRYLRRKK